MAIEKTFTDILMDLVDYKMLSVFTMIPAVVTKVNYKENHLNAQPLIRTMYSDKSQQTPPELFDVPIFILSANSGSARITMPVKVGDTVLILYSQRNIDNFYNSNGKTVVDSGSQVTHGSYPVMALPCLFTRAGSQKIDSSSVIIENGSTKTTISPSGDVTIDAPTLVLNGNLVINGNINATGDVANDGTLTNAGVNVGSDHTHAILSGSSAPGPTDVPS